MASAPQQTSLLALDRRQLSQMFNGNPAAIKAFENLFQSLQSTENVDIPGVEATAEQALNEATQALSQIGALALLAALGATLPPAQPPMAASDPLWPPATPFDLGAFADLLKGPVAREPAQPPFPDPLTVINRAPEPLSRAYMDDYAPPLALDAGAFLGRNEQMTYLYQGAVIATLIGVNLNATGDNIVPIQLPTGFTRFTIQAAYLSNPSITPITTAMVGLYRFASQVDPIAAQQAVNLTNINPNAPGNMMELTLSNPGALALSQGNIPPYVSVLFNVGTAQGAAATADLTLIIVPIP